MRRAFALIIPAVLAGGLLGCDRADMAGAPRETVTRRLNADQYRNIVKDVFGETILIGGRFEPEMRANGLMAVGSARASVSASGVEQYDAIARSVAAQVVDPKHRDTLISCKPRAEAAPDDACAEEFFKRAGHLLYRRPLTGDELKARVAAARTAAETTGSFYSGLGLALAGTLQAPSFLFRKEVAEPDPATPGQYRLDAHSKAAFLSFFLWNTIPDEALLAAAGTGELNTSEGLSRQVERMLASPRLEDGVRAFFVDMLEFDAFSYLTKDKSIYPRFTAQIIPESQEQTLRTILDAVLHGDEDYRDIFTTRRTFLTPSLAAIYRVPVLKSAPNGGPDNWWQVYEYPENDPRNGILTQVSFVALHSHPGRSSPTLRGKALRQIMLCQQVPSPPANVNFSVVQDTGNPIYKTARERVTAHRDDPTCAGCHKIMDPIGLALENFDAAGGFRLTENGAPIDASGEIDGAVFSDAAGLGQAVRNQPAATSCLVDRMFSYAMGRPPQHEDNENIKALTKRFVADGHRVRTLMKTIATSAATYRVAAPTEAGEKP